jgi:hypothetical protein
MRTWTTTTVGADPVAVLDPTTGFAGGARDDPQACRRWAPVAFDVSGLQDDRLSAGGRARVTGRLAGRSVGLDVHVHEAADGLLGRVLAEATAGLLAAGLLDTAVSRMAREALPC